MLFRSAPGGRRPYSASKAGGDLQVLSHVRTYGADASITRGSNTYGPNQYPEKLIPVVITEAIDDRRIPIYGDGQQRRDWLYVEDHCAGIDFAMRHGAPGEAYNVGGGNERFNLQVVERILDSLGKPRELIEHVPDRPGHDIRYSVDSSKLAGLGWAPTRSFEQALDATVRWYADNEPWWRALKERSDYVEYFKKNYGARRSSAPVAKK